MAYSLMFSESFFTDESAPYETAPSDQPTTLYQAILSLDKRTQLDIARNVLHYDHPVLAVMSESFASDVLEHCRQVNTCSNLSSPVSVWIDPEGWITAEVYDRL